MAGLLAADIALNPTPADRITSTRAMIVLSSLVQNHRLVMPDVRSRLKSWAGSRTGAVHEPSPAQTLVLMVPLVAWLRRTDAQLLDAAAALAFYPDDDPAPQLACGAFALWLRGIVVGSSAKAAWAHALEIQRALVNPDWAPEWALDAIAGRSHPSCQSHPVIDALGQVRASVFGGTDFAEIMTRARQQDTPDIALAAAAAAAPLNQGLGLLDTFGLDPSALETAFPVLKEILLRGFDMPRLNRRPDRTSESHPLPIVGIPIGEGMLGVSDFPGESATVWGDGSRTRRDLSADLKRIRDWGGTDVISLLPVDAFIDHDVTDMDSVAQELGMDFYGAPSATIVIDEPWVHADRKEAIEHVVALLSQGRMPVLHARNVQADLVPFLLAVLSESKAFITDAMARQAIQSAVQALEQALLRNEEDDLSAKAI